MKIWRWFFLLLALSPTFAQSPPPFVARDRLSFRFSQLRARGAFRKRLRRAVQSFKSQECRETTISLTP